MYHTLDGDSINQDDSFIVNIEIPELIQSRDGTNSYLSDSTTFVFQFTIRDYLNTQSSLIFLPNAYEKFKLNVLQGILADSSSYFTINNEPPLPFAPELKNGKKELRIELKNCLNPGIYVARMVQVGGYHGSLQSGYDIESVATFISNESNSNLHLADSIEQFEGQDKIHGLFMFEVK